MECPKCYANVLKLSDLFFFCKKEKDIHLCIKPEILEMVCARNTIYTERESQKKVRVKCKNCSNNLGCELPFGPNGTKFYSFACVKIKLAGRLHKGKQTWWKMYNTEFHFIETRDMATFFNVFNVTEAVEKKETTVIDAKINFPSLNNLNDFEWITVSLDKQPRQYQIEAFIEALQRNIVVVIKTGAGKTLVASMFLARMCNLNPSKMGLMIVDRVPLVFQQGDAIHKDSNLRVARICGENRTAYKVKQLNGNSFDVLVITAGAFYEMVTVKKELDINIFCAVVLDECHHVSGAHRYVDVLKLFTGKRFDLQPRILGLTASPVNAKTMIQAENRLTEFIGKFPANTKIFCPTLQKSDLRIDEIRIRITDEQGKFIREVIGIFESKLQQISRKVGMKDIKNLQEDLLNSYQVKGDLRSIDMEYSDKYPELSKLVKEALLLLESLEMCSIMGVQHGYIKLQDSCFADVTKHFEHYKNPSTRLRNLHETIRSLALNSKTLVFVSTRDVARTLTKHLRETFKDLKIDKVVGHGGYDGMDWEGDQERIIQDFAGDQCNLLVCTSVLEEGIDVAQCDLVVCFTGVQSLIKFIQARGRARKKESRFIVYQSEAELARNRNLQLEEEMLSAVLKRRQNAACYFTDMSKGIIRKIEAEMKGGELSALKDQQFQIVEQNESDFSFMVYIDRISGLDEFTAKVKAKLTETLEEFQEFRLNRLDILGAEAEIYSLAKKVFNEETIIFLVGVKCSGNNTPMETYKAFCQIFSYALDFDGVKCHIWTKAKFPRIVNESVAPTMTAKGLKFGYFVNKTSIVVGHTINDTTTITIDFRGKDITLRFVEDFEFCKEITIPKTSIGNFALVSSSKRDEITIAFNLTHCPKVERITLDNIRERMTLLDGWPVANALSKYPVLFLSFHDIHLNEVTSILDTMFPVPYFNTALKEVKGGLTIDLSSMAGMQDILWSLKCLEDSRSMFYLPETPVNVSNIFMRNNAEQKLIEKVIRKCCYPSTQPYFYGFQRLFNEAYRAFIGIPSTRRCLLDNVIPANHDLIKRVVITPLRIIALSPVPVASNRLLRRLSPSHYSIIIVSFKDEDLSKVHSKHVLPRINQCISKGIELNDKTYHFLCSTGSQLRDHKAYFIATDTYEDVLDIRRGIIPKPEDFKCSAKYLSRLGIYGTADIDVGKIIDSDVAEIDDLCAENNDLVTDGAGKISLSKAKEITKTLGLDTVPSAFQIRYSGIKGILVTTHDFDPDLHGKQIAVRKDSMIKFRNDDRRFCITSTSKINTLTLNREIITLLCSVPYDWNLDNTLVNYQETALSTYAEMFNDVNVAQSELRDFICSQYVDNLVSSQMDVVDEKYWISILQGIYRLRSREIRTKASIPIKQSCLIIGVPDPFGVLREDEVFVQLRTLDEMQIIEGPILMFRNPCLHPGDMRTVTGVNKEALKHLFNVVVLPVNRCRLSLASSCSGGDLDGDQYAVIWDSNLIPPKEYMYPPCDYSDLATPTPPVNDVIVPILPTDEDIDVNVTDQKELGKFFTKFMSNDCLGRVAHKHLALCDLLEKGARDPLAVELAKSQSQAVDFPKTGIIPLVPKKALSEVKSFPDFMEKPPAETHISKKILGILYRRCCSLSYDFDVGLPGSPNVLLNMNLFVQGNEKYLEAAADVYTAYAYDMEMLMRKFELKVEADVILGQATFNWSPHLEADKGKASKAIVSNYEAVVGKYRNIFFSDLEYEEACWEKASAWYRIVNDSGIKITKRKKDARVFRSFPWVVSDILCDIRRETNREQPSRRLINIGESALEHFKKNSKQLQYNITEKLKKLKEIENAIDKFAKDTYNLNKGFIISAYGSTSIYVSEPDSDIDICVLPTSNAFDSKVIPQGQKEEFGKLEPKAQQKHFLQFVISRAVDTISSEKKEIFDARVPIVKCSFKDGDKPIHCDISMNEIGYRKTMYIRHLYETKDIGPCYLPLFWILVRWARISGIVKSTLTSHEGKILDTADFYALIIHVLELPGVKEIELRKPSRWSGIKYLYQQLDKFKLKHYHKLGKMIFDFFRNASILKGNIEITWPAPGISPSVKIDDTNIKTISGLAAKSYHALSATRDVNALLNYFLVTSKEKNELTKVLPLSVSYAIGKARAFHAARLSEITGALVTIDLKEGKNNLVLQGVGSRLAIENLQNEIRSLMQTNKALVLGRLPQKSSRYFMEGSSIIIARHNSDTASILLFENSFGSYELHHHSQQRSSVYLKTKDQTKDEEELWKERESDRLHEHIYQQMQKFPSKNNDALVNSLEITCRFGCFYLVDIDSHMPDAQNSVQIQELQMAVEKGRRSRKAWKRGEFKANYIEFGLGDTNPTIPSFRMVPLRPGGGDRIKFVDKVKRDLYKNKKGKRGIAAAYTPGLLKNNTRDDSARNILWKGYHTVLEECGFYFGKSTNRELPPAWKVSVNPSSSYEAQINLDKDMKVLKVSERPLNWVHGTILDGGEQNFEGNIRTNSDVRLLISTQDCVKEGDLYQSVLPGGVPPFAVKDGRPVLTNPVTRIKRAKNFVSMVRNVQTIEVFTNGIVDACVVYGDIYFGDQLKLNRPFCELSLYYNTKPIAESINDNFGNEKFEGFVKEIFETSMKVKERLDVILRNHTSK